MSPTDTYRADSLPQNQDYPGVRRKAAIAESCVLPLILKLHFNDPQAPYEFYSGS
jgi:hypothetical protein